MRTICVSEETETHGEEACRFEKVKDFKDFAIVRAHDDSKYFCLDMPKLLFNQPEVTSYVDGEGKMTPEAEKIFHELPEKFEDNIKEAFKLDLSAFKKEDVATR